VPARTPSRRPKGQRDESFEEPINSWLRWTRRCSDQRHAAHVDVARTRAHDGNGAAALTIRQIPRPRATTAKLFASAAATTERVANVGRSAPHAMTLTAVAT